MEMLEITKHPVFMYGQPRDIKAALTQILDIIFIIIENASLKLLIGRNFTS